MNKWTEKCLLYKILKLNNNHLQADVFTSLAIGETDPEKNLFSIVEDNLMLVSYF